MGRQLGDIRVVLVFGVVEVDGDDLVVPALVVGHGHDADGAGPQDAEGRHRLLAQHEDVERITVRAVRLRQKAVVGRVVDGAVQDTIESQKPRLLVELVFHLRALRDLDDRGEVMLDVRAQGNIVPGVEGHGSCQGVRPAGLVCSCLNSGTKHGWGMARAKQVPQINPCHAWHNVGFQ